MTSRLEARVSALESAAGQDDDPLIVEIQVFAEGDLPEDHQMRTTDGRLLIVSHVRADDDGNHGWRGARN